MDIFAVCLFVALSFGSVVKAVKARCPGDYKKRVETCIMEAQLAPQAGGGITLVVKNDTIVNLCDRGILRKTIDCLEEIRSRCESNTSVVQELNRLYSVPSWELGAELLCRDTQLFQDNFECMQSSAGSVASCILMCTQAFRVGLSFTDPENHTEIRRVTCSFAERVVNCLCGALEKNCPADISTSVEGAMRNFLPPYCIDHNDSTTNTVTQQSPLGLDTTPPPEHSSPHP